MNAEGFRFEIKKHIGILNKVGTGYPVEVNLISYRDTTPKIDIRKWDRNNNKMLKGIALSEDEAKALVNLLVKEFKGRSAEGDS